MFTPRFFHETDAARIEAKFKLSQNRSPEDRRRVVAARAVRGTVDDAEMARLTTGGA